MRHSSAFAARFPKNAEERSCGGSSSLLSSFSPDGAITLLQVVLIDLSFAADNALVIGAIAATVPPDRRRKLIFSGVILAAILRIIFAGLIGQLLELGGIVLLGGGLLLLGVASQLALTLWRAPVSEAAVALPGEVKAERLQATDSSSTVAKLWAIVAADFSMSLDNVLAVAAATRGHPFIMAFGVALSVVIMGFAAGLLARYAQRFRWIAWAGIALITYLAVTLLLDGWALLHLGP